MARQLVKRRVANGDGFADVLVNLAESPLGWLMRRAMIDGRQFDAGEQLRRDFHLACLDPSTTMLWDPAGHIKSGYAPGGGLDPTLVQIAAKRRFHAAVDAAGPGLSDILWRVVCAGDGLSESERAMGWPARAGKVVLGLALDRVASHYGMR